MKSQLIEQLRNDPEEVCFRSLEILYNRCTEFCENKNFLPLWIPDIEKKFPERLLETKEVNVLLLGAAVENFFQCEQWPNKKYRFFCLSSRIKKIFLDLCFFSESEISVIDRYDLFPADLMKARWPNAQEDWNFVYAGRISDHKNIDFLLYFIFFLQLLRKNKVTLTLAGPFDNMTHRYVPHSLYGSYEKRFFQILEKLPWQEKPKYLGIRDSEDWKDVGEDNPIYINFSSFIFEDFSVSAAQAQSWGWPVVLTQWGGFLDVAGKIQGVKIDEVSDSYDTTSDFLLKAKNLANKFNIHGLSGECKPNNFFQTVPDFVELKELISRQDKFKKTWGVGVTKLPTHNFECYYDQNVKDFFHSYRSIFSV